MSGSDPVPSVTIAANAAGVFADRPDSSAPPNAPIVIARNLSRWYRVKTGLFGEDATVKALQDVSFELSAGRTLAVVGESGCGKSTLARQITMVEAPTSGELTIAGHPVANADRHTRKMLRQTVQMVFQNPYGSLNPRKTVADAVAEPVLINLPISRAERQEMVAEMLAKVGLRREHAQRYPHMFSGGQRQRVAIARAMILHPQVVVADEPVSALDVSIQAQILNLFMDLQAEFGTAYLFISHNLAVVRYLAQDLLVMYFGRVVEKGVAQEIFAQPLHPYTRALIAATPGMRREGAKAVMPDSVLKGELPSPLNPPPGCAFAPRCPFATERCTAEVPLLREFGRRLVACHNVESIPEDALS